MAAYSLPNVYAVSGPSADGTRDDIIADLCAVLINVYDRQASSRPATKEDACIFRMEVETRLRLWMKALPDGCDTCHDVSHTGPCQTSEAIHGR